MFFLIPIGSEAGVRRLPFITLGLIAVNTIVWIVTAVILSGQVTFGWAGGLPPPAEQWFDASPVVVPEPATGLLLVFGALALGVRRR